MQGLGTIDNPYVISAVTDWNEVINYINNDSFKYVVLGNDIDFKGDIINSFPSGLYELDGKFFTLKNIALSSATSQVFDVVSIDSTIKNINIDNVYATSTYFGIVGMCNGLVEKIQIKNLTLNVGATNYMVGGIVRQGDTGTIKNCSVQGTINYTPTTVTSYNSSYYAGGIVGVFNSGSSNVKIINSYAAISVPSSVFRTRYNGLCGNWASTNNTSNFTITNSYFDRSLAGTTTNRGGGGSWGRTTTQLKQKSTYSGWDFTNTWGITEGVSYPQLLVIKDPIIKNYKVTSVVKTVISKLTVTKKRYSNVISHSKHVHSNV